MCWGGFFFFFFPVAVVDAAISFIHIGDVVAPVCPYNELAVILYACCKPSNIEYVNGSGASLISFLYFFRADNKSIKISGIIPLVPFLFSANLHVTTVPLFFLYQT